MNGTLREELLKRLDALIHEEATQHDTRFGAPKPPCAVVKSVALDLLATNRAQAEEIEKLNKMLEVKRKIEMLPRLPSPTSIPDYGAMRLAINAVRDRLNKELATVTQERDTYRQEAEQAQARCKELEGFAKDIRDNYDHDADAHRHGTPCRVCDAETQLSKPSPTAALEAVVQRAREEQREKVAEAVISAFMFNHSIPALTLLERVDKEGLAHTHWALKMDAVQETVYRAAGLREGGKNED